MRSSSPQASNSNVVPSGEMAGRYSRASSEVIRERAWPAPVSSRRYCLALHPTSNTHTDTTATREANRCTTPPTDIVYDSERWDKCIERWTLSAGQLIDIVKWNLLCHIPVKMRGAEDDEEETTKSFTSV